MRRAFLGAILGGVVTFGVVFVIALVVSAPGKDSLPGAAIVAALLAGNGATTGAVIGAAGDVAAQFRRSFPHRHAPERDYIDPASADHDPLPGVVTALRITGLVVLIAACLALVVLVGSSQ